ncbi:MAG: LTA synthase family protein [Acidobacteriota bacterium]
MLDVRLWLFVMAVLTCARVVLIALFRSRMDPALGASDFLAAAFRGMAYDAQIAAWWVMPSFFASVASGLRPVSAAAEKLRWRVGYVFVLLTALVAGIDAGFFREFEDQFNHFIFALVEDDAGAMLTTIWSKYHPVETLLAAAVGAGAALFVLRQLLPRPGALPRPELGAPLALPAKVLVTVAIVLALFVSARGSLGRRPREQKDMAVTRDEVLNRTIYNPYTALRYAVADRIKLTNVKGLALFLPDQDIRAAAKRISGRDEDLARLDLFFERRARGEPVPRARHIYLLVLESYDSWTLLDDYRPLGLAECGRSLAARGLSCPGFLPDADGTASSLSALITGLPDAGVATNYQASARRPYLTSPAAIFRRLGYRTRLFYSGYLSWQRLGDFAREQGFDEVYGGPHMGARLGGNEWGVTDEELFDFVLAHASDERPTFDLVLDTSNHPPFNVDVKGKGFPLRAVPSELAGRLDPDADLVTLGHFWYQDREVCRLLDGLTARLPRVLIAATGDHYSRRFPGDRPTLFEKSAVPLILFGPEVLNGRTLPPGSAGSHVDILPTLIELAAPAGFSYHAIGHDLLAGGNQLGLGKGRVIGADFIADVAAASVRFESLAGQPRTAGLSDPARLKLLAASQRALAWWWVMHGVELQ